MDGPARPRDALISADARAVLDAAAVAMIIRDDHGPVYANAAFRDLVGIGEHDPLGDGVLDYLDEESRQQAFEYWTRRRAGEPIEPIEVRLARRDGTFVSALATTATCRLGDGTVAYVGSLLDFSLRKQAEEAVDVTRRYYEAIIRHSSDSITVLNADGSWRFSSDSASEALGFDSHAPPTGGIFGAVHPDDLAAAADALAETMVNGPGRGPGVTVRIRAADGSWRLLDVIGSNLLDDPDVHGVVISSRDVTGRRHTEEALARSEQRFTNLVDALRGGIWVTDGTMTTTYCNPRMAEMLKTTPEEMVGTAAVGWVEPSSQAQVLELIDRERRGEAVEAEVMLTRADGVPLWAYIAATPEMIDGEFSESVAIVTDITELKENARELEAASNAKSAFLSLVSHELRTPLNAVLGYASLLTQHQDATAAAQAAQIQAAGEHLLRLIDDLLAVTRIQAGGIELARDEVDLAEMCERAVALVDVPALLRIDRVRVTGFRVVGDADRIVQVLVNLIANAVRYSPTGGVVRVWAEALGDTVRCSVYNEGVSVAPEDRDRMFRPFVRLDETDASSGAGLGLAISRGYVDAMGGTMGVGTGAGTTVWFELPGDGIDHEPAVTRRIPVLYVEDDARNRMLLHSVFATTEDLEIESVGSLAEATAALSRTTPAVIVLDIRLPDGSGLDALPGLCAHAPVIVATADATPETTEAAFARGAAGVLIKPLDLEALMAQVRALAGTPPAP